VDPIDVVAAIAGGIALAAVVCWLAILLAVRHADRRRRP
jgi:hypothetical protein